VDPRRLRAGEWIAGLSGVALLVSLSLPWYRTCDRDGGCDGGLTGWQALTVNDVVLFAVALAAIGLLLVTVTQPTAAIPIAYDALLFLVSLLSGVIAIVRVLALPAVAEGRGAGVWVALVGAIGITVGAAMAMRNERLSGPGPPTDGTGRPAAPPAVEELPAPPSPPPQGRR